MMMASIDPGLKGGICFAGGDICEAYPLPYIGNEIDDQALRELWNKYKPDVVVCEQILLLPGRSKGILSSGINFGRLKQFALDRGASWHEVRPSAWTKSVPKEKQDRVRLCREKYPNIELKLSDDGMADAILLKEFAYRTEVWK